MEIIESKIGLEVVRVAASRPSMPSALVGWGVGATWRVWPGEGGADGER